MLVLDGSAGEGGGQVVRTALALSLLTRTPFRLRAIRARRDPPGLRRQHLAAVSAAADIGGARVAGAEVGSSEILFEPAGEVRPGHHEVDVGSAGSTMLVLQTVLFPLLAAAAPSTLRLSGGTHNPFAPPFEFVDRVLLSLVRRMGGDVRMKLDRAGFYPAGGGLVRVEVAPAPRLAPLELLARGSPRRFSARAIVSNLPASIADRELKIVARELGWDRSRLHAETLPSPGPGNVVLLEAGFEHASELVSGFGEKGRAAEAVAGAAAAEMARYLRSDAPVGERLADQLLLPLAMAGSGRFRTTAVSSHFRTNADVIGAFLPLTVEARPEASGDAWEVKVERR